MPTRCMLWANTAAQRTLAVVKPKWLHRTRQPETLLGGNAGFSWCEARVKCPQACAHVQQRLGPVARPCQGLRTTQGHQCERTRLQKRVLAATRPPTRRAVRHARAAGLEARRPVGPAPLADHVLHAHAAAGRVLDALPQDDGVAVVLEVEVVLAHKRRRAAKQPACKDPAGRVEWGVRDGEVRRAGSWRGHADGGKQQACTVREQASGVLSVTLAAWRVRFSHSKPCGPHGPASARRSRGSPQTHARVRLRARGPA
jgi:hypothetical protein